MLRRVPIRASHWAALAWVVAFAVIGMHHVGGQEHPASAVATAIDCCAHGEPAGHAPSPSDEHGTAHLCLAILAATLVLASVFRAFHRRDALHRPTSVAGHAGRPRSPPPRPGGAPVLLATLCVLRL